MAEEATHDPEGCPTYRDFTTWRQKIPVTKCYPQLELNPWTSDSKSSTLLSYLIWHVLFRRSLNFCSITIWFLDDLVRINRTWLYKDPKVSVLKANVWDLKSEVQGFNTSGVQYSLGVTFATGFFFYVVKPLKLALAWLQMLYVSKKNSIGSILWCRITFSHHRSIIRAKFVWCWKVLRYHRMPKLIP